MPVTLISVRVIPWSVSMVYRCPARPTSQPWSSSRSQQTRLLWKLSGNHDALVISNRSLTQDLISTLVNVYVDLVVFTRIAGTS